MLSEPTDLQPDDPAEPLIAALVEIERYVAKDGWDQPPRLFALVPTVELLAAAPDLADRLPVTAPDALSSIEQDDFPTGDDLAGVLAGITWPDTVSGCAISLERSFLPAELEAEIPTDPQAAASFVANHPSRQDVRVVAGVVRAGEQHSLVRLASAPDDLLSGTELVPGLGAALAATLN